MRSILASLLMLWMTVAPTLAQDDEAMVIARVNGEPITLEDFFEELAARHVGMADGGGMIARQDPTELLGRLVNVRLILQEARNIGLDELPEVERAIRSFANDALRGYLFKKRNAEVEVSEEEVRAELRKEAGEFRIRALFVKSEETVSEFRDGLRNGADFAELAASLVEAGQAEGGDESPWIRPDQLFPEAREALWALEPGEVTPALEIDDGYAVVQLLDSRVPDDPQRLAGARQDALQSKQLASLLTYLTELIERHAEIDWELLESLEYEAPEPGLETLLQDERVIARISDGSRITVGDFSAELKSKFFHGMDKASGEGRVNRRKRPVLDSMLRDRVALIEARALGLHEEPEYVRRVTEFERRVLFATFVNKAIDPSLEIEDEEVRNYVKEHSDEFTTAERMRIETFGFSGREDAERALDRLQSGADPTWVRKNTGGQIPADQALNFGPTALPIFEFPPDVRAALAGARQGDFRFLAETDGPYYVLHVREVVPPEPLPLETIRGEVRERLTTEKRLEAVDAWADELRAASQVELLMGGDELSRLVGMSPAEGR